MTKTEPVISSYKASASPLPSAFVPESEASSSGKGFVLTGRNSLCLTGKVVFDF